MKKSAFDHCLLQLRVLEIYFSLLPSLSHSHMFAKAGCNPSMDEVMRQESDQKEHQWERPPPFEILTPVQALPLTP